MQKTTPFQSPEVLLATELSLPNRDTTPHALKLLSLNTEAVVDDALLGYRTLYGLDKLAAKHWQGYLDIVAHKIHVQVFQPLAGQVKGTVWLLHGYLEHSGLYQPIIGELLAEGFAVLTYDLPGHGLSDGAIASISEFSVYQDILQYIGEWASEHLNVLPKPWLGIGQSTGGAILIDHSLSFSARRQTPMMERLLLLSPLVRPAKSAWWHNSLGLGLLKKIKKDVPRSFRRNNHNPEFLRFVRLSDPLQPRVMGMDWILALARWMVHIEQLPASRVPVWMAQGAQDQTVDWRYNVEFIRKKFRLQTLLMLEEGSHQLINERADIRAALTALIPAFLQVEQHKQLNK